MAAAPQRPSARAQASAQSPAARDAARAPARPQGRTREVCGYVPRDPPRIGSPHPPAGCLPPVPPARQGKTARRAAAPARRQPARSCFHSRCRARSAAQAARQAFPATASLRRPSAGASVHSPSSSTFPVREKRSITRPSRSAIRSAQPPAQPLYSRTSAASISSSLSLSPHAPLKW